MKNAKLELLKKISKYSKEDIIEALGRQCQADFIIRGILNDLEYIASKRVFDDYDKAIKEHKDAFEAYIEWKNQKNITKLFLKREAKADISALKYQISKLGNFALRCLQNLWRSSATFTIIQN